jgi:gluconolactonase
MRVDSNGALWVAAEDGAHCFAADGSLLGKIKTDEVIANLCFGGAKKIDCS